VGQEIDIQVTISAAHDGYYEFRLCTDPTLLKIAYDPATSDAARETALHKCVTNSPLLIRKVSLKPGDRSNYKISSPPVWTDLHLKTRWRQQPQDGFPSGSFRTYQSYSLTYLLPAGVVCDKCILHMYWQTLNNWQADSATTVETTSGERFW
jgi:hypothetical protein